MAFNHDVRVLSTFADSREQLRAAAAGLRSWGSTRLYDAVGFGLHAFVGSAGRRALIVLSDGTDTESDLGPLEVASLADRAGVLVFPISLTRQQSAPDEGLRLLAEKTGGQLFVARTAGELQRIYERIEEILRLQYLLVVEMDERDLEDLAISVEGPELRVRVQGYHP